VRPEYRDHAGETIWRDHAGVGKTHYKNDTGRNDLRVMKVARDGESVYFYVRCGEAIRLPKGGKPMMLLIDWDQDAATGWEGFDYVVKCWDARGGEAVLEKCAGGWKWEKVGGVCCRMSGRQLHVAAPLEALGFSGGEDFSFDFKWVDNVEGAGDVMDFYLSGDVAPEGRFKFRYATE
jgi:hypothetical protein